METSTLIATVGVSILLLAFTLSLFGIVSSQSVGYEGMNLVGAALACYASVMIHFTPFIILEAAWSIISLIALARKFFPGKNIHVAK